MKTGFPQHNNGFHLTELLVVVAIISITTAFAFPLYTDYIVQAQRTEAKSALSQLALALEHFRIEHNTYENATLKNLKFPEQIAKGNYQLAIQSTSNASYVITAQPLGKQFERDISCASLSLDSRGEKNASGTGRAKDCW